MFGRRTLLLAVYLQCALALAADVQPATDYASTRQRDLVQMLWGDFVLTAGSRSDYALPATFCSGQPSPAKCERVVDTMTPVLLEWMNRRVVTEDLFMLAGSRDDAAVLSTAAAQDRSAGDCSLCKYAVAYIKTAVESQATKEAITTATQEACAKLPAEFQDTCIDVVVRYEDLLLQYIQTASAAQFCSSVGACKASTLKPELPKAVVKLLQAPREPLEGSFCGTCKVLVQEAHALVEDPDTQQEITDFIKNSCAAVVPAFADICSQYVDEYAPAVFALLDEYLNNDLCTTIGFCDTVVVEVDDDILAIDSVLDAVVQPSYLEPDVEEEVEEQQMDVMAYVASLLMDEDRDFQAAVQTQQPDLKGGADADSITPELVKSLGLTQRQLSKPDTKLPQSSDSVVVSRRLLANRP